MPDMEDDTHNAAETQDSSRLTSVVRDFELSRQQTIYDALESANPGPPVDWQALQEEHQLAGIARSPKGSTFTRVRQEMDDARIERRIRMRARAVKRPGR